MPFSPGFRCWDLFFRLLPFLIMRWGAEEFSAPGCFDGRTPWWPESRRVNGGCWARRVARKESNLESQTENSSDDQLNVYAQAQGLRDTPKLLLCHLLYTYWIFGHSHISTSSFSRSHAAENLISAFTLSDNCGVNRMVSPGLWIGCRGKSKAWESSVVVSDKQSGRL